MKRNQKGAFRCDDWLTRRKSSVTTFGKRTFWIKMHPLPAFFKTKTLLINHINIKLAVMEAAERNFGDFFVASFPEFFSKPE
jgi:hypothetical protein